MMRKNINKRYALRMRYLIILISVLIFSSSGLFAYGTLSGTILTNLHQTGQVNYFTATNAGDLSAFFTNSAGVTNKGNVNGPNATTTVNPGFDLSMLRFTNGRTNNGAAANTYLSYGGYITNHGNQSESLSFTISNFISTPAWITNIYTLYTNGIVAAGPSNTIHFTKAGVPPNNILRYAVRLWTPAWIGNGASNEIYFHVNDGAPALGDSWPNSAAILPATSDAANLRDNQTNFLMARVQGPVLHLSKTVDVANARPFELITYTIVYTNVGSANALGLKIRDTIPNNTTNASNLLVSTNGSASIAGGAVVGKQVRFTNFAGVVGPGKYGALQFTVRVK